MNTIKVNPIFAGVYASLLSDVASLAVAHRLAQAEAGKAAEQRGDKLADKLREYARQTAEDGVSAADARDVLRVSLSTLADDEGKPMIPAGTVKGYGASFAGFRDAIANGVDPDTISVKEAQERVASDETKALNAARKALRDATKGMKADALMAVAAYAKAQAEAGDDDESADEGAESAENADAEPARQVVAVG